MKNTDGETDKQANKGKRKQLDRQKRDSKRGTHEMLTVRQTNRRTRGKENSWTDRRETAREVHTRC